VVAKGRCGCEELVWLRRAGVVAKSWCGCEELVWLRRDGGNRVVEKKLVERR
jgi:ATP-dependent helicase YprA (DUF1998 family)